MSAIEWTEKTWNPIAGCSKVSPGCQNCYAEKMAARLDAMGQAKYAGLTVLQGSHRVWSGKIAFDEEALLEPLRRKKPTTYFVNSMSDLFHEGVEDWQIDRVFAVMALCPQHTFQVLTKRPERMYTTVTLPTFRRDVSIEASKLVQQFWPRLESMPDGLRWNCKGLPCYVVGELAHWPLRNVRIGVSVENQKTADERLDYLSELASQGWLTMVSFEPLLELVYPGAWWLSLGSKTWGIVGGESGPGARPFNIEWARSIVKQCAAAGVACFVKQMGSKPFQDGSANRWGHWPDGVGWIVSGNKTIFHLSNRKGGDPSEWPEDLRVRQMPEVRRA